MSIGPEHFRKLGAVPPREPRAELRTAAASLHELFTALINEGFSEAQSLAILGHMLATNRQA